MKVLLDEMYPAPLAEALRAGGIEACTASELGLAGWSDADLFAIAVARGFTVLTENVADFAQISAEHLIAGRHHPGVQIALSSRFSRRRSAIGALFTAVCAAANDQLGDRIVYLQPVDRR